MTDTSRVSACLVTRGDVDLTEILQAITGAGIDDVRIWNNALERDLAVYGRYAAVEQARHDVIYVQDDDCVLDPPAIRALVAAYEPGVVTCNMPPEFRHDFYVEHALVGFGAVFDRDLPERAFDRLTAGYPSYPVNDGPLPIAFFYATCDVVFTALTPRKLVEVPVRNLPWATGEDRMYRQPEHVGERQRMLDLALQVRGRPSPVGHP